MYLKKLDIQGFKSFANKTELDFKTRITAVVGPNGSGKSNIAEAFRFVLGEQSLKNMRGKKGEDLIFSGKNNRLNRASVKVIFDNADRTLNIDYKEVLIERIVYRDGVNEYLINGSKARAKDIVELLGSANIGSSGHHIISQGEADRILSLSPKERKILLEDALGLKAFVFKKNDAEKKIIKVEANLKEVKVQEKVNAPRIRFLKREVQKIEKIKSLKDELKELYVSFFPIKKQKEVEIKEIKKQISDLLEESESFKKKIISKKQELDYKKHQNQKQDNIALLEKIEQEISSIEDQKNILQKTIIKNELLIEEERKKIQEAETLKNQTEIIEKDYNEKLINVSGIFHKAWISWAKSLIASGDISDRKKEEWKKKFINFSDLSKEQQEKWFIFSKEILDFFDVSKEVKLIENFDFKLIEQKKQENIELQEKIKALEDNLDSLFKKKRILSSTSDNAQEVFQQEVQIEILKLEKQLEKITTKINSLVSRKNILSNEINDFEKEESFAISLFGQKEYLNFLNSKISDADHNYLYEKIVRIKAFIESIGDIPQDGSIEKEYLQLKEAQENVEKEIKDLENSKIELNKLILDISEEIEKRFKDGIKKVNQEFSDFFKTLFVGGEASIFLVDIPIKKENEDDVQEFELGIDLKVALPNKKIKGLGMLSGGERSLTSIALLFAMSSITPPPFIILDETDAALDEANSKKYGDMIEKLSKHSQLILITHNRETMSRADLLYGVTMAQDGASKMLSISLKQATAVAK